MEEVEVELEGGGVVVELEDDQVPDSCLACHP